jgi:hypothetical protein
MVRAVVRAVTGVVRAVIGTVSGVVHAVVAVVLVRMRVVGPVPGLCDPHAADRDGCGSYECCDLPHGFFSPVVFRLAGVWKLLGLGFNGTLVLGPSICSSP